MAAAASRNAADEKSPGTLLSHGLVGLVGGNNDSVEIPGYVHPNAVFEQDFIVMGVTCRFQRRGEGDVGVDFSNGARGHEPRDELGADISGNGWFRRLECRHPQHNNGVFVAEFFGVHFSAEVIQALDEKVDGSALKGTFEEQHRGVSRQRSYGYHEAQRSPGFADSLSAPSQL